MTEINEKKQLNHIIMVDTQVMLGAASDEDIIAKLSKDLKVGYFDADEKKYWAIECSKMFDELKKRGFELTELLDEILAYRMIDK
ncbi:MAG TPA: hypothetical protein ENI23_06045 [bacterium]|nr:hypothetical protein [bacterium]